MNPPSPRPVRPSTGANEPQPGVAVPMMLVDQFPHGVVLRIKSHNARHNASSVAPSLRSLLSIKFALYGKHHAADGFYCVTPEDAKKLKKQTSRWSRSITWPKCIPADLATRKGGIFG